MYSWISRPGIPETFQELFRRSMIGVVLKDGESIESALKRFKRECVNAGIQSEIKRREFFEKPSELRKRKIEAAIRKRRRKQAMMARRDRG